jgi:VanZ family protein
MRLDPARLPKPLRVAAYAAATAILLYLCLAPSKDLPHETLWDKAEHAIAWFVLASTGLLLAPRRPRAIVLFAIGLGALVEVLQATLPFGRDGDWHDLVADSTGVAAALVIWAIGRGFLRRR